MNKFVFLRGGLGNQFFQWVYALNLNNQGYTVNLDTSFLRKIKNNQATGNLELEKIFKNLHLDKSNIFLKFNSLQPLISRSLNILHLSSDDNSDKSRKFNFGYYQNNQYFNEKIISIIKNSIDDIFFQRYVKPNNNYCAVHIRSGDYKNNKYNFQEIGILSSNYYKSALSELNKTHKGIDIVVISDDEKWAKEIFSEIKISNRIIYLSDINNQFSDWECALSYLKNATALICANSSFSALSAYIGQHENIYYPSPWMQGSSLKNISPLEIKWTAIQSEFIQ